jgi:hypothetical protein
MVRRFVIIFYPGVEIGDSIDIRRVIFFRGWRYSEDIAIKVLGHLCAVGFSGVRGPTPTEQAFPLTQEVLHG